MIGRRELLMSGAAAALSRPGWAAEPRPRVAPVEVEDGHYTQPWFVQSFLTLAEDLAAATQDGKRFAIVWQQLGCPYCAEMHKVNFADPDINDYVRTHFSVVELDLYGSREVTDFDGQVLAESDIARKYRVTMTPTWQFFPESVAEMGGKRGRATEIVRMPGYYRPFHFQSLFEFVSERAYKSTTFPKYVEAKVAQLKAQGQTRDW